MKTNLFIQFAGKEISAVELEKQAKAEYKKQGRKLKDAKELSIYVKPEEFKAYVAVDGQQTLEIEL